MTVNINLFFCFEDGFDVRERSEAFGSDFDCSVGVDEKSRRDSGKRVVRGRQRRKFGSNNRVIDDGICSYEFFYAFGRASEIDV